MQGIPDTLKNARGQRIDHSLHQGAEGNRLIVVLGHGVTGNKDRPLLVRLGDALAAAGIWALRISFAGNGDSEGRFEDCTVSSEVEDLRSVLDALSGWKVGYAGHSMGAAVGTIVAADDDRIRFLVSLAGMAHTEAFAEREFGALHPGKDFMWDKRECPLSQAYMDDMRRIRSVVDHAKRVRKPWLFVHGSEDDVVPVQDSRDLIAVAPGPHEFVDIVGADHVFSDEAHVTAMADAVVRWVRGLNV